MMERVVVLLAERAGDRKIDRDNERPRGSVRRGRETISGERPPRWPSCSGGYTLRAYADTGERGVDPTPAAGVAVIVDVPDDPREIARRIRLRALRQVIENKGGYLSQACSSAEALAVLYTNLMNIGASEGPAMPAPYQGVPGPDNPDYLSGGMYNGPKRPELDRFILSPTHYSLALYVTLVEVGRLAPATLDEFEMDGGTLEMIGAEHSPGLEITSGSFGQAISQAAGMALARRLKGDAGHVWLYISDGEMQEGQTWEALASMAHHRIDNLTVLIDANGQQVDGRLEAVTAAEPMRERIEAFGAKCVEIDGHDVEALLAIPAERETGRPLVVICRTDPVRGMEVMRDRYPETHYVIFRSEEERERYRDYASALEKESDT